MSRSAQSWPPEEPGHPLSERDPRTAGPYVLLRRLGGGGMGTVYLARHRESTWRVALKVIHENLLEADPQFRVRFIGEIDHARRVQGQFTARIVDADPNGPMPWMATEYVPGETLSARVSREGPLPARQVLEVAAGIAEALGVIHSAGLVHRDLKPANVILAHDAPRVIDFEISKSAASTRITSTGAAVGTLAYMSPEQLTGESTGSPSDLFSLGGLLCFAASGRPPFSSEHYGPVMHAILTSGGTYRNR